MQAVGLNVFPYGFNKLAGLKFVDYNDTLGVVTVVVDLNEIHVSDS